MSTLILVVAIVLPVLWLGFLFTLEEGITLLFPRLNTIVRYLILLFFSVIFIAGIIVVVGAL